MFRDGQTRCFFIGQTIYAGCSFVPELTAQSPLGFGPRGFLMRDIGVSARRPPFYDDQSRGKRIFKVA